MRASILAVMLSLGLAGCADDADLGDSPPTETPGGDDSAPVDSATPDSTTPEDTSVDSELADTATPDTFVSDTFVADTFIADTFAADTFVADTFVADTFMPDTFMPDTAPVDTCVVNACGGCTTLTAAPGTACGTCGGMYTCSGTNAVTCTGSMPVNACGGCLALTATPGTACGTCGGMIACSGMNAVTCSGSMPLNACGGCNVLTPPKDSACGICGTNVCSGTTATTCSETATVSTDLLFTGTSAQQSLGDNTLAFAYPVRHKGRITTVGLLVSRYHYVFGTSPPPWSLTVELWTGTPAAPGTKLGGVTYNASNVPSTLISATSPAAPVTPTNRTVFNFATTTTLNVGDPVHLRITRVGGADVFIFQGAASGGPADLTTHDKSATASTFTTVAFDPEIEVKMNGCF
jgi:hypothetical protein